MNEKLEKFHEKLEKRKIADAARAEFPTQLKNDVLRFCKVHRNEKAPVGLDWTTRPFKFNDTDFLDSIRNNGINFGVLCGHGHLIVIDWDDKAVYDKHKDALPDTFQTMSPSPDGCPHSYYFVEDENPKGFRVDNSEDKRVADVQGFGTQVLGPGSVHPNHIDGEPYKVVKNIPIAECNLDLIRSIFDEYEVINEGESRKAEYLPRDPDNIIDKVKSSIKISAALRNMGVDSRKNLCACPFHHSKSGKCLSYDDVKGIWNCFHCKRGGDIFDLVGIAQGVQTRNNKAGFVEVLEFLKKQAGLDKRQVMSMPSSAGDILHPEDKEISESELPDPVEAGIIYYKDEDEDKKSPKFDGFQLAETLLEHYHLKTLAGILYKYDAGFYRQVENDYEILKDAKRLLKEPKFRRLLTKSQSTELQHHLKSEGFIKSEKITADEKYLAFRNCLLNLETRETRDFDPDIFILNKLNFNFDPDAKCPEWIKYLNTTFTDEESRRFLQQITGYIFLRRMMIDSIFFFYGIPGTGKSTYQKVMQGILGPDNCASVKLTEFKDPNSIVRLQGKLANIVGENKFINQRVFINDTVLEATSGDMISGKLLYRDKFEFVPYATQIINFNNLPNFETPEGAFFDRLYILEFPNKFRNQFNEIKNYERILIHEAPGIVNWAFDGLKQIMEKQSFDVPEASVRLKNDYRRAVDPVSYFAEECLVEEPGSFISSKELYDVCFQEFLVETDCRYRQSYKEFNKQLRGQDFDIVRHGGGRGIRDFKYMPL